MPNIIPRLSLEEVTELMKNPDNKCLEFVKCECPNKVFCAGYSTVILCEYFHSLKSDFEKREFYRRYGLCYQETKKYVKPEKR